MARTLSAIRTNIRQLLRDEFVSGSDFAFPPDEIDIHIDNCLVEISQRRPYEVKETLTTSASKELDISSIDDLLEVDKVEYPVDSDPPDYRNCSVFGNTLRIDISSTPSADEDIYLFCHKVHQLTESSSTLIPQLEKLLIDGTVGNVALAWLNTIRKQLELAITRIDDVNTSVDSMSARLTQAITDLTTGRSKIGFKVSEANTAIGNMSARITQSITDLTSGRALIGSKKTQAIAALDAVSAEITQAGTDLTTGRGQISDLRNTADTAIDDMTARITQALADLTSGRDLINNVNIGGSPESDYANYAGKELNAGLSLLSQARAYLNEGATSSMYQLYAARDLQKANAHIAQARGYIALDVVTEEYALSAARELSNANVYAAQARMYLSEDMQSSQYANNASKQIATAMGYLNQSGGYMRELTSRINISRATSSYQVWANNKLVLYYRDLKRLAKPKIYVRYPVG